MKGLFKGRIASRRHCYRNALMIGWTRAILFGRSMCVRRCAGTGRAGFDGVTPAATGRPGYHPSPMLKLYIFGYLNRVQSSRRLEREAGRNLEVMWLTGPARSGSQNHCRFPQRQRPRHQEGLRAICRLVPQDGSAGGKRASRSTAASSRRSIRATTTSRRKDGAAPGADRGERCALSEPA